MGTMIFSSCSQHFKTLGKKINIDHLQFAFQNVGNETSRNMSNRLRFQTVYKEEQQERFLWCEFPKLIL